MIQNVFHQNGNKYLQNNSRYNQHTHSCPFCRCTSMDNSIDIKIKSGPSCNYNILIGKDFIDKKIKNSRNDENIQNVYYRSFVSPIKRGLSPNGSKKIVIQYSNPIPNQQNNILFNPIKPAFTSNLQNSVFINQPQKKIPRNIYTNQNTPPKSKYLQKRSSSRKDFGDKNKYSASMQELALVQSQKVKKAVLTNQPKFGIPNQSRQLQGKMWYQRQRQKQISPIKNINDVSRIPYTMTENMISRGSGGQNATTPFDQLDNVTLQVLPYGSFSSSPIIQNESSTMKNINPPVIQAIQSKQVQTKPKYKMSQPAPKQFKVHETPQLQDTSLHSSRFSYNAFNKASVKPKSIQRIESYEEMNYSQSDQITLSNRKLPQGNNCFGREIGTGTRSGQSIALIPEQKNSFSKKVINIDTIQLSDNFQTPKSKYKTIKERVGCVRQDPKVNDSNGSKLEQSKKSSIRFLPLNKSPSPPGSTVVKQSKNEQPVCPHEQPASLNEQPVSTSEQPVSLQLGNNRVRQSSQPGDQPSSSSLKSISHVQEYRSQTIKSKQMMNQVQKLVGTSQKQPLQQSNNNNINTQKGSSQQVKSWNPEISHSSVNKLHATQLVEQLRLNYDYYVISKLDKDQQKLILSDQNHYNYQIIDSRNQETKCHKYDSIKDSSLEQEEQGSIDITF